MNVKRISVGISSRQEANDVADHQNDIGREQNDRKVVYVGEGFNGTPLYFVAIAETEQVMKEMVEEFLGEVPEVLIDVAEAPENA